MNTHLIPKDLKLSWAEYNKAYGQHVRFWCFNTWKYVKEKHTYDHEAFMRQADAGIIRTLLIYIQPDFKKLAEKGELRSVNVADALAVIAATIRALSVTGDSGEQYRGLPPYSPELLYTVGGYLELVLPELNTIAAPSSHRECDRIYSILCRLAADLRRRYEVVAYADLKNEQL